MKYNSHVVRHELYVAAAAVGAHANSPEGFRQREVKFLMELFINWSQPLLAKEEEAIHTTQVSRYLGYLVEEGYARILSKKRHPYYRLTRTGLLELLSRIASTNSGGRGSRIFFLYFFLKNYRDRLFALVEQEGRLFPRTLRIELEEILNIRTLLTREITQIEKEIDKLDERIADAQSTSALTRELLAKKIPFTSIVERAEREFPYDLNSQKPLSELINSLPEHARRWELEHGNALRVNDIWIPEREMLKRYKEIVLGLQKAIAVE